MRYKRVIVLLSFILLVILVRLTGAGSYLSFDALMEYKESLSTFVDTNYLLAVVAFILTYIIVIGTSIPGAAVLTLASGFLFGAILGTVYSNIGATIGATIIFFLTRYLFGDALQKRYEKQLRRFNKEIRDHGKNYLLMLRLIVVFPFFVINILAGLSKVPARTFVWTTSLGIIPGSFVYAYAGSQLYTIQGVSDILSGRIIVAIALLGVIAIVPVIYKKFYGVEKHETV